MPSLRLLAAADVHGMLLVYEWLVREANRSADVLILAGDLFSGDVPENQQRRSKDIVAILRDVQVPTLYLMGNDDEVELGYEDELIRPLHGRVMVVGGFRFAGYQHSPPFVGEAFVRSEEEMAADLRRLEPQIPPGTVLVTHCPARGAADVTFGGERAGSTAIRDFLKRVPVLAHIHGHIHESFGREGKHFNVASAGNCRAMRIVLPSLESEIVRRERGAKSIRKL